MTVDEAEFLERILQSLLVTIAEIAESQRILREIILNARRVAPKSGACSAPRVCVSR